MNQRRIQRSAHFAMILIALTVGLARPALASGGVVQAVLFYSPTCPHCHLVITQDLPPLIAKYGNQLQIAGVDTTVTSGQALYQAAIQRFNIPPERRGVPTLIIAGVVLVGDQEIPQQFPGLIEKYLALGGVGWPDIPGLSEALAASQAATASAPTQSASSAPSAAATAAPAGVLPTSASTTPGPAATPQRPTQLAGFTSSIVGGSTPTGLVANLARDPLGNGLAVVVLLGMLLTLGRAAWFLMNRTGQPRTPTGWHSRLIPVLALGGVAVAAYLTYVESTGARAVCGPLGDCNTVQQSVYAHLFGVLPIALFGLAGFAAILSVWAAGRMAPGRWSELALAGLWGLSFFGTLFSIYLTFLEPFVIGATCAWCLTSAILMASLLWLTTAPGWEALSRLFVARSQPMAGAQHS